MCKRVTTPAIAIVSTRLIREEVSDYAGPRTFSTPEQIVEAVNVLFDLEHRSEEHFVAFGLTTKNTLIRAWTVSTGSLNASIVHPRELFRVAVGEGCAAVIVAHNHPSGDPTPSGADIQLVRRLVRAGDVLGIELLDSVVIGADAHVSMRDIGLM